MQLKDFDEILKVRKCGRTKIATIPKHSGFEPGDILFVQMRKPKQK